MATIELDPLTLGLVLQLQLQDLEELAQNIQRKGKGRQGEASDSVAAIEIFRHELSSCAQLLSDKAMCQSIAHAVDMDGDAIRTFVEEEERAISDRELALLLSGVRKPRASGNGTSAPTPSLSDRMFDMIKTLAVRPRGCPASESDTHAESSTWAASRPPQTTTGTCLACCDEFPLFKGVSCMGCSHHYCPDCIESLFRASITDETLFPPKCCGQPISIDLCRHILPVDFRGQFHAKKIEFETPNRTYCSQPSCSTFIPLGAIKGDVGTCVKCSATTCSLCKKPAHSTTDCPDDPAARELMRLAEAEKWRKCSSCSRYVELTIGCNHITCRCGAQFCYECGETWKRCRCELWEEGRLMARANNVVNREPGNRRLDAHGRANLVNRARENLVANHECLHRNWGSRTGRHRCEQCHDMLPNYIYECRQCRILACRRCRYNRLG
ncbi:putative RING finger protein [Podospora aff. communis PSN243]|uniref:RBR-type E3 ubiquitin transferase n=1 Tax=Podospora aff. communis PSN243 TaxID=3040156 RepID=A0AAV9GBF1_9PEZI|nr:putative RING finger protein [Podospora aff. communis PSN243]